MFVCLRLPVLSTCCDKHAAKSLEDFQIVEQTRGDPDIGEQLGAGAGLDEDGTWVNVLLSAARRNGFDSTGSGECMLKSRSRAS